MPNPIDISAKLNGLIPYENYNYVFTTTSANWPIVISPVSGSFTASSVSGSVDATVYFCLSKDSCNNCDGLLPYDDCLCNIGDEYFGKIQMSCSLDSDPSMVFKSDIIKVTCEGCLPSVQMVAPSGSQLSANVKSDIYYIFENLRTNKTYSYEVETISSDWPFYVSAVSGLITAGGVQDTVEAFGVYCATTGECPSCEDGVLPYTIPTGCVSCSSNPWTVPETSLRLRLIDPDCPSIIHYSNILNLSCKDCGQNYVSVSVEANDPRNCSTF